MSDEPEIGTEEWARSRRRPFTNRYSKALHDKSLCCASVRSEGGHFSTHQCGKKPKVFYGELGYCGTHDPVAAENRRDEKSAARSAQWKAESEARERTRLIAALQVEAVAALKLIAEGHNDPRALAAELLARFPA